MSSPSPQMAATAPRRLATVHDLSSLQLHSNGSRVQQYDHDLRHHYPTSRDRQGNLIAKNAAGPVSITRRLSINKIKHKRKLKDINANSNGIDKNDNPAKRKSARTPASASIDILHERASFERAAAPDLSLSRPRVISSGPESSNPSSDLLKSIHYYAIDYYRKLGILDISNRHHKGNIGQPISDNDVDGCLMSQHELFDSTINRNRIKRRRAQNKTSSRAAIANTPTDKSLVESSSRDAFRAFDGSALVAIGMLLQEHVKHSLLSSEHQGVNSEHTSASASKPLAPSPESILGTRNTHARDMEVERDIP